jgi:hypothetical protein
MYMTSGAFPSSAERDLACDIARLVVEAVHDGEGGSDCSMCDVNFKGVLVESEQAPPSSPS